MIEFFVEGHPYPQGSKSSFLANRSAVRAGAAPKIAMREGSKVSYPKWKEWRKVVTAHASLWMSEHDNPEPLDGPLALFVEFVMPKPQSAKKSKVWCDVKPDKSKLLRAVEDSLTDSKIIRDDARICVGVQIKRYAEPEAATGAFVRLMRLDGDTVHPSLLDELVFGYSALLA